MATNVEKAEKNLIDLEARQQGIATDLARLGAESTAMAETVESLLAAAELDPTPNHNKAVQQMHQKQAALSETISRKRAAHAVLGRQIEEARQALFLAQVNAQEAKIAPLLRQAAKDADRLQAAEAEYHAARAAAVETWIEARNAVAELADLQGDSEAVGHIKYGLGYGTPMGAYRHPDRALEMFRAARKGDVASFADMNWRPKTLREAFFDRAPQAEIRPGRDAQIAAARARTEGTNAI